MHQFQTIFNQVNSYAAKHEPFLLLVDFDINKPILFTLSDLADENIFIEFPTYSNCKKNKPSNEAIDLQAQAVSKEIYAKQFDIVQQNLQYGNSFLTNLTLQTPVQLDASLQKVFETAQAKYKILFKNEWVCFSPETFIQIVQNEIYTFPMKGTIDANLPNAIERLLADEKEKAEHYTIVDLLRNDISSVASQVKVEKFRYIDTIKTVHGELVQTSSKISGKLPNNFRENLAETIFKLLPAGSISGAPKKKTVSIIHEAEDYERGYYTGVAFLFDGHNIDSCVLIRFIEKVNDGFVYKSGGGITINSQCEDEYNELIQKIYVPVA